MNGLTRSGLVSVIVASYNHAEYLQERMESLINQTYQNIEIIVIDDCSTDASTKILRKYENHPKVKLIIRKKNAGWVAVSNQGVKASKGEFIIFANCDDSCESEMIETLVKSMMNNQTAGISYCRSKMIDNDGKLRIVPKEKVKEFIGRSPDYSDALAFRMYFELASKFFTF